MKYSISFLALLVAFSALPFTSFAQSSANNVTPRPAGPSSTIIGDQNPVLGDGKSPLEKRIESIKPFMTSPQNGQSFKSLDTMNISWTPQSDKKVRFNVRIEPATSSTKYKARNIATNVSGSGTKWKIPRNVPAGDYKISLIQNARLNGKNIPITLGKATVGINKVETPVVVATSTTGSFVFSPFGPNDSVITVSSNQDGSTNLLNATFKLNVHALKSVKKDDLLRYPFRVVFESMQGSSTESIYIESQSVSFNMIPNQDLEEGNVAWGMVSAFVSGYHPDLESSMYRARIINLPMFEHEVNQPVTGYVTFIKPPLGVGWRDSFIANASTALGTVFDLMFGWMR